MRLLRKWKSGLATLLAVVMLVGLLPVSALGASAFSDVDGHWGEASIQRVVDEGLFNGTSATTFDPDGGMTRSMFVTVLSRLAEKLDGPEVDGEPSHFEDVPTGVWYTAAVDWAVKSGVTTGYGNDLFGPDDLVTREQLCVFLVRFLDGYMGYDLSAYQAEGTFADDGSISDWAKEEVYLAQAIGLVQGIGNNLFNPQATATRASVAAIADRLLDKTAELSGQPQPTPTPTPTPTPSQKPSGGGGGGGGSDPTPSKTELKSVYILRDGVKVTGKTVYPGDKLYVYVDPYNAVYSLRWLVGGVESGKGEVYTVTNADAGNTIVAEATGTGDYKGTVTSAATGMVPATLDPTETDPDKAPVVVDAETKFTDVNGNEVAVEENSNIIVEVNLSSEKPAEETKVAIKDAITALPVLEGISEEDAKKISVEHIVVDVDLVMTSGDGEETTLHTVGKTTVTLTKEQLGLPASADLSLYIFAANHTNVAGEVETVEGKVVDGGKVRFELNGLSRIYVGNVPPRTVTFNTDGGTAIESQKVKLGQYVQRPENPTKEGMLFAGWDYDLAKTQIVYDITVKALWVKGTLVPTANIEGNWALADADENLTDTEQPAGIPAPAVEEGKVTLDLTGEGPFTPSLRYVLHVLPMEGATQAAAAPTAEAAMNAEELKPLSGTFPGMVAKVTDAGGAAQASSEILYIKWADADGKVLGVQSVTLTVKTDDSVQGEFDTQVRAETVPVDRGLGQMDILLESGATQGDVAGYVNAYVQHDDEGYYLSLNGGEDATYRTYYENPDDYTGEYRIDAQKFETLKLIFTPFEGESYSGTPTATATYWDQAQGKKIALSGVNAALVGGKLEVSADIKEMASTQRDGSITFTISLGGKEQVVHVYLSFYNFANKPVDAKTWDEVLGYLAGNEYNYIRYTGTEDVTLTSALTISPRQIVAFQTANLTIGRGGVLTMEGDVVSGGELQAHRSTVTVADGGKLATNAQDKSQGIYSHASIFAQNFVAASGSQIEVPYYGFLQIYSNGNDGDTINLAAGSKANIEGRFQLSGAQAVLNGDITIDGHDKKNPNNLGGDLQVYESATVGGTITLVNNGYFQVDGGTTVEAGGKLVLTKGWIDLSGSSHNYGAIQVDGGELNLMNLGYSVYNDGTIAIGAGASTVLLGTVLVNTGTISGAGELNIVEGDDVSKYDDGIEYTGESEWNLMTPTTYERYQFVRDPAAEAEVLFFAGELSNMDGGTCTATVNGGAA